MAVRSRLRFLWLGASVTLSQGNWRTSPTSSRNIEQPFRKSWKRSGTPNRSVLAGNGDDPGLLDEMEGRRRGALGRPKSPSCPTCHTFDFVRTRLVKSSRCWEQARLFCLCPLFLIDRNDIRDRLISLLTAAPHDHASTNDAGQRYSYLHAVGRQ
jgi:hypothetical protein